MFDAFVSLHLFSFNDVRKYAFLHTVNCNFVSLLLKHLLNIELELSIMDQVPVTSLALRVDLGLVLQKPICCFKLNFKLNYSPPVLLYSLDVLPKGHRVEWKDGRSETIAEHLWCPPTRIAEHVPFAPEPLANPDATSHNQSDTKQLELV